MAGYELIGSLGCGSAIVEAAFTVAGIVPTLTDIPYLEDGPARSRLLALNPLGQVPTLILPDGTVMTESAAMILHLADVAPGAGLVPPPSSPDRARFFNLLIVIVGAIYPTFTFGDIPDKWTHAGEPADALRANSDRRREELWRHVDAHLEPRPFVLGETMSALDLYVCVMGRWRPRLAWFAEHTPRLRTVIAATERVPPVAGVLARNFPA